MSDPAPSIPPSSPGSWPAARPTGLARPVDFEARSGAGLRLGLSLGGGGLFFVAWQVSYLHELSGHGIDLEGPTG